MTVNGAFQINQGSWTGSSGTWAYGSGGTLIFNNTSAAYGPIDSTHVYWPASSGPTNVTVQGAGGINLGVSRTVAGVFQTVAGVTLSNSAVLTLNGTARINSGGYFNNAPTYGASSTLQYYTSGTYLRGIEWSASSGPGYPANVQISNNTTLNYPNGSTAARSMSSSLTVDSGSALYMDYGSPSLNNPLTVGGNVTLVGSLSLGDAIGGDLNVGGNWTNNGGTFNPAGRAVTFNGTTAQTIGGSSATTFDYLTLNNPAGASLAADATVNQALTLTNGVLAEGTHTLTVGIAGWVSGSFDASHMIAADGGGKLCKNYNSAYAFTFPIGDVTGTAEYSPATLDFRSGDASSGQACVSVTNAAHPGVDSGNYPTYINRHWTVTTSGISGFACDVYFRYTDADLTIGSGQSEAALGLWKVDGSTWAMVGATTDAANNILSAAGISSFSQFTGRSISPLAVALADFRVEAVNGQAVLTWETVSEQDNAGFNVYRGASENGPWVKMNGTLIAASAPGSSEGHAYHWTDETAAQGTYWYQLEDVDLKGQTAMHGPLRVGGAPNAVNVRVFTAWPDWGALIRRLLRAQ